MIHLLLRRVWFCGLVCVIAQGTSQFAVAKKPKMPLPVEKKEQPAEEKRGVPARMRVWKACDPANTAVQIVFTPDKGANAAPFTFSPDASGFQFTNYQGVPAAAGVVTVTLGGHPPVRIPVNLSEGGDSTLLVQVRSGEISARWINETPAAEEAGTTFKTYNLLAGNGGDVQVVVPGASSRMGGLKAAVYPVTVNGTDTDGKTFKWSTEADLKRHRHATLLIYPDGYGRIRPRLIEDGQPTESSAKASTSKSQD